MLRLRRHLSTERIIITTHRMPGLRGFLCLLFDTSLAPDPTKPAGETSENTKEKLAACGSHIAAIGHVPHVTMEFL